MHLRSAVTLRAVRSRRSGTQVILRSGTSSGQLLLNDQYWTMFVRGHAAERDVGEPAPDHSIPDGIRRESPAGIATVSIAADQATRYAQASGDDTAYHVDEDAARAAGFPAVILHGLCTLALAVGSLGNAAGFDDDRIVRVAARFVHPMVPGGEITTTYWRLEEGDASAAYAFEAADDSSEITISHGRVELR